MNALYVAAAAEAQNPLVPHLDELIIGLIAFAIVFGFLAKKLLPNINKVLDERREAIEGGIEKAEEAKTEAQSVLEQYKAQLDEARHEAARLRQEATEQGATIIQEMKAEGQRQREEIVAAGHAQIEADRKAAASSSVRTWASSPPTSPASSSGSPLRTAPGRAAPSTASSTDLRTARRRLRQLDDCDSARSEPRGAGRRT